MHVCRGEKTANYNLMNTRNISFPSNRVSDIRATFRRELADLYPEGEIAAFVGWLMEAYMGWDTTQMLLHNGDTINQSDLLRFHHALADLKRCRPIQHIVGYTDFCGCRIKVSPDVLIPRPETAELVACVVEEARQMDKHAPLRIVDLCTGSGCIAIAVAREMPDAEVMAVDVSEAALEVAKVNAADNGVEVRFVQADILGASAVDAVGGEPLDIIVSNPPYIMHSEQDAMRRNVLDYEPHMALFVDDADPLLFYRAIADIADRRLARHGIVAVEINEMLGDETVQLFADRGYRCELYQDINGKDRIVVCRRG